MQDFIINVGAVALVLGVMILVHEFGHYAAAKLFGVRVEVFSIGFGKRLLGFKKGDTDYRIAAIPLGGYVKMSGENFSEEHSGAPYEFMSHPRWQRLIIAFAGPFMNIVLAIGLLTGVFMVRYEHPVYLDKPAVIGWVLENSPAAKAGFEPGDRIVRIGSLTNPTWEDVLPKVWLSSNQPLQVTIERNGQTLQKTIVPEPTGPDQIPTPGWLPDEPNVVTALDSSVDAAEKAGIKVGDTVVAVNGQPVKSVQAMIRVLQENKTKPAAVTVVRSGKQQTFTVTPQLSKLPDGEERYRIGIVSQPMHIDKLPFAKAFSKSLDENRKNSVLILELVEKMIQRKVSVKQMSGPIGIAQASGDAARQQGWTPLLALMSAISLNLAIFNLFPIPILDGGMILMLLVESVRRRDISLAVKERIYQVAYVLLILFAVMVIYNDLTKAIPGLQRLP
ncbi:MAG TPA: RIP metalloprotease RseP [Terriglobales bacterium]|nr:RIP metalloprotease RseP [Terriglobales bacterium]